MTEYIAITELADPEGCEAGDAFVVAPDGSRAGIVWDVRTTEDFAREVHAALPRLREIHDRVMRGRR